MTDFQKFRAKRTLDRMKANAILAEVNTELLGGMASMGYNGSGYVMEWQENMATRHVAIIGGYGNTDRRPQLRVYVVVDGNKKQIQQKRDTAHIKSLIISMVDSYART